MCWPSGPRRRHGSALCWPRSSSAYPGFDLENQVTPEEWIAHDPDPHTAAELAACDPEELAARFGRRVRGGPDAMNLAVVLRATWAVAQALKDRAGAVVIVGRDARHGSAVFAT